MLILIAGVAGIAAALGARRFSGPRAQPVAALLEAAGETGRRGRRSGRGDGLSRSMAAEEATGLTLTLAFVLILGGGLVLAGLAILVSATHALAGVDGSVATWGARHATAFSTHGLKLVTDLGETWMAVVAGVLVALIDLGKRRSRWVVPFLLAVLVGDNLLTQAIKQIVGRVRPHLSPIAATLGPSFPSGHSSTAAALWAATALIACRWWGRRAWPVLVALAVSLPVGVAASRVLLDVHWLTDVIAGLALGWAWFAACTVAFGGRLPRFGAANTTARAAVSTTHEAPP